MSHPGPATVAELLELPATELDGLFRRSAAGAVPSGRGSGVLIPLPGTRVARPLGRLLGVAWRGKEVRPGGTELRNLVSPLAVPAVPAAIRRGPSRLDGRECLVLDYAGRSRVAGWLRDEMREVGPGVYLGHVYGRGGSGGGRRLPLDFALAF